MQFELDTPYSYLPLLVTAGTLALALLALPSDRSWTWRWMLVALPWAAEIGHIGEGTDLTLPPDAFAAILGLIALVQLALLQPYRLGQLWQQHSLFRWLLLYFLWMGIVAIAFSTEPLISIKFWVSQGAYFVAFGLTGYLWATHRPHTDLLSVYAKWLLPSASLVLLLLVYQHLQLGGKPGIHRLFLEPFMREHTVYGAYSAWFFTAALVLFVYRPSVWGAIWVGITGAALVLSYSRGGWLSALGALGLLGAIELVRRLSPAGRLILLAFTFLSAVSGLLFLIQYNPDVLRLQARRTGGELSERFVSSFDVRRNLSNLERINRWYAALQMIQERPLQGFGPNTFSIEYSAYQSSLTRTSVSVEMGEVGGAHSEYFTAASELGLPGLLLLLGVYLTTLSVGIRGFWRSQDPTYRWTYALLTFPLMSYYLHGLINNFMDHGHIAALVYLHWGFFLMLERKSIPSTHASAYASV